MYCVNQRIHIHVHITGEILHANLSTYMCTFNMHVMCSSIAMHVAYLEGIGSILFVCLVVRVMSVRLSVHWTTTSGPLQYVATSPFFCLLLTATGIFFFIGHHCSSECCANLQ